MSLALAAGWCQAAEPPRQDLEPLTAPPPSSPFDLAESCFNLSREQFNLSQPTSVRSQTASPASNSATSATTSSSARSSDPQTKEAEWEFPGDMSPENQESIRRYCQDKDETRWLKKIVASPEFHKLSSLDKQSFVTVLCGIPHENGYDLAYLLFQDFKGGSKCAAGDSHGGDLIGSLAKFVSHGQFAVPELQEDKGKFVVSLIDGAADTNLMVQRNKGTCAVSSILWYFANVEPGEYTRLVVDLCCEGKAEMRARGQYLIMKPDYFKEDGSGIRLIDQVITITFMEYADGPNFEYNDKDDKHYPAAGTNGEPYGGSQNEDEARLLGALFDRVFVVREVNDSLSSAELTGILRKGLPGCMLASLRWSDGEKKGPVTQAPADAKAKTKSWHAVIALKADGDRIVFHNPWGNNYTSTTNKGDDYYEGNGSPHRRVEDKASGKESITVDDFSSRLSALIDLQGSDLGILVIFREIFHD